MTEAILFPANLTVRGEPAGSLTELDGSRITHDVTYSDADFTPEGIMEAFHCSSSGTVSFYIGGGTPPCNA